MYERSLHVFDVLSMSLVSHQSDMLLLTTSTAVTGGGVTNVCLCVCLFCRPIFQKPLQPGSPNTTSD